MSTEAHKPRPPQSEVRGRPGTAAARAAISSASLAASCTSPWAMATWSRSSPAERCRPHAARSTASHSSASASSIVRSVALKWLEPRSVVRATLAIPLEMSDSVEKPTAPACTMMCVHVEPSGSRTRSVLTLAVPSGMRPTAFPKM